MKLWWIDVETTGLSTNRDELLEIAVSTAQFDTPFDATPVYHRVIEFPPPWRPGAQNPQMSDFVREMHTKSGLLDECARSGVARMVMVGELEKLIPHDPANNILAGSSVHFDRGFLPYTIAPRFSHRHYDVSSIKLFCESLGMPKIPKDEAHRAQADVLESIEHARRCEQWLAQR